MGIVTKTLKVYFVVVAFLYLVAASLLGIVLVVRLSFSIWESIPWLSKIFYYWA